MNERIEIKNFGGIKHLDIELKKINVFIGKQASGKSMVVKLVYFFKGFLADLVGGAFDGFTAERHFDGHIKLFFNFFPVSFWHEGSFEITYHIRGEKINISGKKEGKIVFSVTDRIKVLLAYSEKNQKEGQLSYENGELDYRKALINSMQSIQNEMIRVLGGNVPYRSYFVPAGRVFYAQFQKSIHSLIKNEFNFDPFYLDFALDYDHAKLRLFNAKMPGDNKNFTLLSGDILKGVFSKDGERESIVQRDGRVIDLSYSSTGQQEAVPLTVILESFLYENKPDGFQDVLNSLFIEEPEAHLFPSSQKMIVDLMAIVINKSINSLQYFITTHSPYILTSFNNLLEAGRLKNKFAKDDNKLAELDEVVGLEKVLHHTDFAAYALSEGGATNLMGEFGLIDGEYIDSVSEDISIQFDQLLDLD